MNRYLRTRVVVDRVLAALLLVPAAPVIAALGWRVRRHDGGPALIALSRVGRNGEPMRMWKLRTMRAETAGGLARGAPLTVVGDARVTPVGRRMRELHLDELPQLVNVVCGEMCLLGPRPESPEFVPQREAAWAAVLECPPGVAGPTQVIVAAWERQHLAEAPCSSTYVQDVLPVKLAIDRWYLERASLRLDALVVSALLSTVLRSAWPRRLGCRVHREVPASRAVRPVVGRRSVPPARRSTLLPRLVGLVAAVHIDRSLSLPRMWISCA